MKNLIAPLIVAICIACSPRAVADQAGLIYGYILNDSHAGQTFYSFDVTKPFGRPGPLRPYLELLLQRNGRRSGVALPQTLNDNYGLLASGMQYQSPRGLRMFAQIGDAFAFGPQPAVAWSLGHSDFRGGLELYHDWNDAMNNPHRGIGSFFAGATYYSRYQNSIAYVAAERGREFGLLEHPTQLFVRVSATEDTRRYFYNDTVNVTLGVRALPLGHLGPILSLEESYNSFLGPLAPVNAAGYERQYFSFRPIVSMAARF